MMKHSEVVLDFSQHRHLAGCSNLVDKGEDLAAFSTEISIARNPYLKDHFFGGKGFVPATMLMELFIEAGKCFVHGLSSKSIDPSLYVQLNDLDIQRAVAVDLEKDLTVRISLLAFEGKGNDCEMKIEISSERLNQQGIRVGRKRVNALCSVIFSKSAPQPKTLQLPPLEYDSYQFEKRPFYDAFFFSHGPLFQSLTGKFQVDKGMNYLIGEYDCEDLEQDFIPGESTPFHISPLGYDSCLQYVVFFSRIQFLHGRLPIGAKRINIFQPHPTRGKCTVVIKCLSIDPEIMESDFTVYNEKNEVIYTAENFLVQKSYFTKQDQEEFDNHLYSHQIDETHWSQARQAA